MKPRGEFLFGVHSVLAALGKASLRKKAFSLLYNARRCMFCGG